jgi:hypothetical protein
MLITDCEWLNLFYFRNRIEYCHEFREKGALPLTVTLAVLERLKIHYESLTVELSRCEGQRHSSASVIGVVWNDRFECN